MPLYSVQEPHNFVESYLADNDNTLNSWPEHHLPPNMDV